MKILAVANNYPGCNKLASSSLYNVDEPVVFAKPDSALLTGGKPFFVPDWSERVVYECCVAARVCRLGKTIPERFAHRYYDALTLCADFTALDALERLSAMGLPWDWATGFDGSAVMGRWVDKGELGDIGHIDFALSANGREVQHGSTAQMRRSIDAIIAHLSRLHTLKTGDIILTGCPAPPCQARIGERLTGRLGTTEVLAFNCR